MLKRWFSSRQRQRGLGLAMSGGAVLGACHAGVLRALDESNLELRYVTGTSSGAMFAVLAAFRVPTARIEEITREMSWRDVSGISLGRRGLVSNKRMGELVRDAVDGRDLAEAPIPVAIVATDIATGERVLIRDGDAGTAVMASACVPGFVHPVERDGHLLVDGGLVENLPLKALREIGAEYRVGVDLSERRSFSEPDHMLDVITNAIDIAVHSTRQLGSERGDLMITPDTSSFSRTDTESVPDLIEAGYAAAKTALEAS